MRSPITNPRPHTAHQQWGGRRAFTLIELIAVITIIAILLGIGTIGYRALTGSHSLAAAQNIIAALLSRARGQAISEGRNVGVFFFRDPQTGRSAAAVIPVVSDDSANPDSYNAWTFSVLPAPEINYHVGDHVFRPFWDTTEPVITNQTSSTVSVAGKMVVRTFRCIQAHTAASGNAPPATGSNDYWEPVFSPSSSSEIYVEVLPVGVGVQTINDQMGFTVDRYLRTGLIAFDETGQLACVPYNIPSTSPLGVRLQLSADLNSTVTLFQGGYVRIVSQVGILLYDEDVFTSQQESTTGKPFTQSDFVFPAPGINPPETVDMNAEVLTPLNPLATTCEEYWLANNAVHLVVDRHTGALTKAE
jgi:prepilin-type N-terminal cleavage/methylation domain-containing protein